MKIKLKGNTYLDLVKFSKSVSLVGVGLYIMTLFVQSIIVFYNQVEKLS